MEQRFKAEMMRVLDSLIGTSTLGDKSIFLFGHCNATEEMTDYLLTRKIIPMAILDNSPSKQGNNYREVPIVAPEFIKDYNKDNSIVLIVTRFFAEMSAQLRRFGYDGEIIRVVEYNTFAEYSLSEETIKRKTERMFRGMITLKNIRNEYQAEHLVICPNNALGDVYWAMSFLPHYCEKHSITETAIIVIDQPCRQVASLFGAEKILAISNTEMDEFVQAVIYIQEENCIIAHHDRPYTDNIIKWLDKHFLSFIDYYRCAVYGLSRDTPPKSPVKHQQIASSKRLIKDKSVILSPYAKSVVELPSDFWEDIAAEHNASGCAVYTNVVGVEEAIKGTEPIQIPIAQAASAAEYAGTFIGLRSGLCDVLHAVNCRKIVIFPDCYYSTTPHKVADFFALPGWEKLIVC